MPQFQDVWIDIGVKNKEEAQSLVRPGDPVTFALGYHELRNGLAASPAMDDKVGLWVVMDAVRRYARRVELLHPQIDNAGSMPANREYPWAGPRGEVLVPAEYDFALDVHAEKAAVTMIKEVRARAMELAV